MEIFRDLPICQIDPLGHICILGVTQWMSSIYIPNLPGLYAMVLVAIEFL